MTNNLPAPPIEAQSVVSNIAADLSSAAARCP